MKSEKKSFWCNEYRTSLGIIERVVVEASSSTKARELMLKDPTAFECTWISTSPCEEPVDDRVRRPLGAVIYLPVL